MDRDKLKTMLTVEEDKRKFPYVDTVKKITIGVGRNLTDRGLRDSEIAFMLDNDVTDVEHDLDRFLPWWRAMSENRQLVLADMCFNMGIGTLAGFKHTLAFMKAGNYAMAATNMRASLWARQVKGRADKLAKMMEEG